VSQVAERRADERAGSAPDEPAAPERAHYRAHLDGLRCLAVYLVVAFHARLAGFSGGFIGVDVFFVLSGYLVTGILLRELTTTRRVGFRRFYSRRMRRILPAAVVTLGVVAFVYSRVVTPSEMQDALGGFKASFLFVANWYFLRQSVDYFASADKSPVLHFWSLAVEEQFYLVWPLLFGGLFLLTARLRRYRWLVLRMVVAAGLVASMLAALHFAHANIDRAYYGTDARAYQLLGGALLALSPQMVSLRHYARSAARVALPIALIALVWYASSGVHDNPIERGVVAVICTVVLIIGFENWQRGPITRTFAADPVAYLGRVSYATYLWHWPIVVIVTHDRHIAPVPLFLLTVVSATALAILSYHFIEQPVRASRVLDRYRMPVIAGGLAVSIVGALVVAPTIARRGEVASAVAITTGGAHTLDWKAAKKDIPPLPDCLDKPLDACTPVTGTNGRILLAGDSNARMWIPAFEKIAQQRSMTLALAILPDCPWQRKLNYYHGASYHNADCARHQNDLYNRIIPQYQPDVVVLVHQAYDDATVGRDMIATNGKHIKPGDPEFELDLDDASAASVDAMKAPGRKIVIIEPIPIAPSDPLSCISSKPAPKCTYIAGAAPTPLQRFYRSLANGQSVFSLDVDHIVCPRFPACDAVVNGVIVKRDPSHLTGAFTASVAGTLDALLQAKGVWPAP
jgi:peptidoglycan/LPS O-acetylase OafA/YrhL